MADKASDKINSLFLSYQDLKVEVRRLEIDAESKKSKKSIKEKELNAMESKIRARESHLHNEKMKLRQAQQANAALKAQAEKERVDQYAVYLELLAAEETIKSFNEQRLENKSKFADALENQVEQQLKQRDEVRKSLDIFKRH